MESKNEIAQDSWRQRTIEKYRHFNFARQYMRINRVVAFETFLAPICRSRGEFLRRFLAVDETWIRYHTPKTNKQSKQWIVEVRFQRRRRRWSRLARLWPRFLGYSRLVLIDYFKKGKTITGQYYATLLSRLREKINVKCLHLNK